MCVMRKTVTVVDAPMSCVVSDGLVGLGKIHQMAAFVGLALDDGSMSTSGYYDDNIF